MELTPLSVRWSQVVKRRGKPLQKGKRTTNPGGSGGEKESLTPGMGKMQILLKGATTFPLLGTCAVRGGLSGGKKGSQV